ncbi:Arginine--tRNA ligase [Mesomycoplasma hyopneumoniae]|uniref:Arginine--tRNA ligase n=1 Tax=Mesomycoplasma hyopneumoniae TaxID=2099 RepID=A0A223M952_MESHO|nr:Arginine--tRNA ligase [Mesomycoplasma hyopneumoniae]
MKKKISQAIIKFFKNENLIIDESKLIIEKSKNFGDYSSNVALMFAKQNKIDSLKLAQTIKNQLLSENLNLEKIEIAPPALLIFLFPKMNMQI